MMKGRRSHESDKNFSNTLPSVAAAVLKGHQGPVQTVVFTADGKYSLTGGNDRTIRLFNPYRIDPAYYYSGSLQEQTKDVPHALPIQTYSGFHAYSVSSIALDESSSTLLSSSDKTMVVSDISTGQLIRKIRGHDGRINSVACSSDASMLLSGSYDATVKVWDGRTKSQDPIQTLQEARDSISKVLLLMETKEIISCSIDGCVRTYDIRKGQLRVDDSSGAAITGMCLSHDGNCVVVSCLNGNIYLLEKDSGQVLNTYDSKHHTSGTYALDCAITANDESIVSGSEDGLVVLYDLVDGSMSQILEGPTKPTCSVTTHPKCASVLLSGSYDGSAVVWSNPSEIGKWER